MNVNPAIHNEMITMEYIECPFCEQQLQEISVNHCPRYDKQSMINDNGTHICKLKLWYSK